MRILGVLLALVLTAVAGQLLLGQDGSPPLQSAVSGNPVLQIDDCEPSCTPLPAPTATPCPYCGQDGDRWRESTSTDPPQLLGESAVLMDAGCGEVLYAVNARERSKPASLAKIATALAVIEHAELDDVVDITVMGWDLTVKNGSSIMGLEPGMRLTVEELLYGLLLPSGNDAAVQLAEHLGGKERLVELMNQRVQALGLTDTHLVNGHGLDAPGAYTTPFDMAVLGRELLRNATLRSMVGTKSVPAEWHDHGKLTNGNYLLYIYEDAIGIKTGFTEGAGWSIVSAAERDGRVLIASVFDSEDIYWDSMRLFDWAFENVESAC